jgi:putative phosphoesterase
VDKQNMNTSGTYRIGVIADTHDRWMPRVAEIFAGVDEIWHLGDVCEEPILDELRSIQPNLTVVLGNNDWKLSYPMTRDLERHSERFHLVHIQPRVTPRHAHWLLFGHTHVPFNAVENGIHYLNPGSAGKMRRGAPLSVGLLTRRESQPYQAEIVPL